jgi:MOSC domain-containing protein
VERVGQLNILRRYPVKSMAGEDLDEARVSFAGVVGDRVFAFIDNRNLSNFPWMTGRQGHELILFRPRFLDPPPVTEENPDAERYATEVTTPEGEKFRMGDPDFTKYLEERFGRSLRLRFSERSQTDARPISVFGLSTVRALSEETGINLDPRRFRANFYVRWDNERPFYEDELIGRELQIGDTVTLQLVKKDERCVMITLDPDTAAVSPQVLQRVALRHEGCAGVYGVVLREGIARIHNPVYLI